MRILIPVALLVVLVAGCDDDTITVLSPDEENQPPIIVHQGPELPGGALETFDGTELALWVVVGDPNGLDDIAAVMIDVDSIAVNRVLLRPPDPAGSPFCPDPSYASNDTLDLVSVIPSTFPGIDAVPMQKVHEGLYEGPQLCAPRGGFSGPNPCPLWPELEDSSDSFGTALASSWCGFFLDVFRAFPPAVASSLDVFVTYADLEYRGVTFSVYDAAGASAMLTLPGVRVVYETEDEGRVAP